MTWFQFFDRTENTLRCWHVFVGEIFTERFKAQLSIDSGVLEQSLDFGCENQLVFLKRIMQGLFAQSIPPKEQGFFLFIPKSKGKHAVQAMQTRGPEFLIKMHNYFGVGSRFEPVALLFELVSKFLEVIDFSVEGNPNRLVFISNGLSSPNRKIDDAEPFVAQPHRKPTDVSHDLARVIGTTVFQAITHRPQDFLINSSFRANVSVNSAHLGVSFWVKEH